MSDAFTVDPDELDNVVARLNGLVGFLHDNLDALDHQVSTLHASSWKGQAARAHADAHRQWASSAREFAQGVADMADAAQHAHGRYTASTTANTRMFKPR